MKTPFKPCGHNGCRCSSYAVVISSAIVDGSPCVSPQNLSQRELDAECVLCDHVRPLTLDERTALLSVFNH